MYREGWVEINGVESHVQTWGGWIDDKISGDSVIICVTGNPGVTGFYSVFLSALHKETKLPVWVINHAGLEFPPNGTSLPPLKRHPELYNLRGQILHKLKFIQSYSSNFKLYLIGHSVGAKMITGLLKEDKSIIERVSQAYFLFPTLEHIAKSRYGSHYVKYGKFIITLPLVFLWLLKLLPLFVKNWMVRVYLRVVRRVSQPHQSAVDAVLQFLQPTAARTSGLLALDKMDTIKDLDLEVLQELGERVNSFYAQEDVWVPLWQAENLRELCPKANVQVMESKYRHDFVLSSPKEVAQILANHISKRN